MNGKVLIVDDIPENLHLLNLVLQGVDMEVVRAQSGAEALMKITECMPDLVLLDISMPEMDGYEVCRIIKSTPEIAEIPVIFLSALANSEYTIKGFEVGGVDYVTKPFGHEELIARVKTHIELKRHKEQIEKYSKKFVELSQEQILLNSILQQQKSEIERKNKDLTDSIDYAKLIQDSLLPSICRLESYFKEVMMILYPKNQVSGDFYYFEYIDNKLVVLVADCTGHGVPGAFVSVLGFTLSNQIIKHEHVTDPETILTLLDRQFFALLSNSSRNTNSTDGMDVAVCVFDFEERKFTFSGSKRPVVVVRDNEPITLKPSHYSIGGYKGSSEKSFTSQDFYYKENDMVFMFSDGYADQFGGENIRKIGSKEFYKLLSQGGISLTEKREKLVKYFHEWKGTVEQIDDVLILGLKL